MSVEPNVASVDYMGDRFTFVDCPGSVEFIHDMRYVLPVCDAAVVVCEADARKTPALQVILRELEELGVPRIVFLNKIDLAGAGVREALEMLQPASRAPLLLRQMPIWENGVATGFVDLALERAFVYRESAPSEVVEMPGRRRRRREAGALHHARAPRRLRRRADGAAASATSSRRATACSTISPTNCATAMSCRC